MVLPALVALAALVGSEKAPPTDAAVALQRLRSLQGEWKGTVVWTGARTDTGEMGVSYRLTGNGSAVVEDLLSDGRPTMTTVYHLDGNDLRMTHYCGAGNQPRLKAKQIDLARNAIAFEFVDATNLAGPDAPHVHGFRIHLVDPDHLELEFDFLAQGKLAVEHITVARVRPS